MSKEPRDQKPHGGQPNKPADHHGSSPVELAAINETLLAFAKKYDENNKKSPRRDWWQFVLEIAAVVGVAAYTVITGGLFVASLYQLSASGDQLKISQDQLKVMQDTEIRQLRAYVHITGGTITVAGNPSGPLDVTIRPGVKVFGQTPAGAITIPWNIVVAEWLEYGRRCAKSARLIA